MSDDAAAVSATFREAMNAVTALREVEKAKKNDEFRARLAIADLTMCMERVEQLWANGILKRGAGGSSNDDEKTLHQQQQQQFHNAAGTSGSSADTSAAHHIDPLVISPPLGNGAPHSPQQSSSGKQPAAALAHFASTVATLHERLEVIAEGMSSVLAAAAKGLPSPALGIPQQQPSDDAVLLTITSATSIEDNGSFEAKRGAAPKPLEPPRPPPKENTTTPPSVPATPATTSPSLRGQRGPVVTLLPAPEEMGFASPTTSGCFSPRSQMRRASLSINDSVSFLPEELFRPDASDLVSRGTMTKVVLTASTPSQASNGGGGASLLRYAQLLEAHCSKEQIEQAKRAAGL